MKTIIIINVIHQFPYAWQGNNTDYGTQLGLRQMCQHSDWACENRAYLHTNLGLIFEL